MFDLFQWKMFFLGRQIQDTSRGVVLRIELKWNVDFAAFFIRFSVLVQQFVPTERKELFAEEENGRTRLLSMNAIVIL